MKKITTFGASFLIIILLMVSYYYVIKTVNVTPEIVINDNYNFNGRMYEHHTPNNGLLLSLEIENTEKWIVRLTWKNVSEHAVVIPIHKLVYEDRYHAVPFWPHLHNKGVRLKPGRHAEKSIFEYLDRLENTPDAYVMLRGDNLSPTDFLLNVTHLEYIRLAESGDEFSCLFKCDRSLVDEALELKNGEKIPIDFTYKVDSMHLDDSRVIYHSSGEVYRLSIWHGEVHSNVVHLIW